MRFLKVEQGSPEWLKAKAGVITGTRAKEAMGTPAAQEKLINKLVSEILTEQFADSFTSKAMQRGIDEEAFALKEYSKRTDIKLENFGLILHDTYNWLGLSPDALTKDLKHAVESKSPNSDTHVGYMRAKKVPKDYHWQTVHYFVVIELLETLDFISYDARVKLEKIQLLIVNVKREDVEKDVKKLSERLFEINKKVQEVVQELTF